MLETNSPPKADQPKPRVRFRFDVFDKLVEPLGYITDQDKARFIGVSPAAISKMRSGQHGPSAGFIAAVRTALPHVPYERLFDEVRA